MPSQIFANLAKIWKSKEIVYTESANDKSIGPLCVKTPVISSIHPLRGIGAGVQVQKFRIKTIIVITGIPF